MKECPKCGNTYPESFFYCPEDGSSLNGDKEKDEREEVREPAQIKIKTLMIGLAVLGLCALIAFTTVFFYLYWKPKYGTLTIKTTPPSASIFVDDELQGPSPITLPDLRSGAHRLKVTKEGYKELVQQVMVMPYATDSLHWNLEPIIPQLSNEQLAEVESLRKNLEIAEKEEIPLPPPEEFNVLFFANKILAIDPANSYAIEKKAKLAENIRLRAELAYAREDWLEAEKQYKNLELFYPDDLTIAERLVDVAAKLDESLKDREKQIQDWMGHANKAMEQGYLIPLDNKDNAWDAIRSIQRLDKNTWYVREAIARLKRLLQSRGDDKIAMSDWQGARSDFSHILQYFPEDDYSKTRLSTVETKISEMAQLEQERIRRLNEEKQAKQRISSLRQSALNSFRQELYEKCISQWEEYLKFEPNSDEAYFYIGASYQNLKQFDTAILNFEKCLSLNPDNVLAHLNLGRLYDYHRDNFQMAEEHLRKAKELGGAEEYTPDRLQSMLQDLQDRAQASLVIKQLFPVEHKHTFSSCRGNVRFTEEGIEYRTTETDHSFYESYTGLRAFKIEGNELSIKTRTNKNYNFVFLREGDAERIRAWASRFVDIGGQGN
jgi:tetratricopeptide (TPR) repeat protein